MNPEKELENLTLAPSPVTSRKLPTIVDKNSPENNKTNN
jgi:hypothetical protein